MGAKTQAGTVRVDPDTWVPALYRTHYVRLVRLAVQLVDDQETAEDLVQDVFAALQAGRATCPPDDPAGYLRTAVVNRSRSALRRRRVARAFLPQPQRPAEAADVPSLEREARNDMLRAIARLPRRQREVVVLRYYEDLPVAEIAAALGIGSSAVSSALSRALTTLTPAVGRRS